MLSFLVSYTYVHYQKADIKILVEHFCLEEVQITAFSVFVGHTKCNKEDVADVALMVYCTTRI